MTEKIYDLQPLNTLVDGNEKFRKYLIELFIQTTPPILEDLKKSFLSKDFENVYAHTHKVKPTLDSMGMYALRPLVEEIMKEAKRKDPESKLNDKIEQLCNKIMDCIHLLQTNEL